MKCACDYTATLISLSALSLWLMGALLLGYGAYYHATRLTGAAIGFIIGNLYWTGICCCSVFRSGYCCCRRIHEEYDIIIDDVV